MKIEHRELAQEIFADSGVSITTEGEKHMGAVIGSSEFKELYVNNKIKKWTQDVEKLTKIAIDDSQTVYSSFVRAICHMWTYVQRTIPGIDHHFEPLEEAQSLPSHLSIAMLCQRRPKIAKSPTIAPMEWREQ